MSAIYLDESGDMGFNFTKSKTSQYFIITCVFIENKRPAEKIIKNFVKRLPLKERLRHNGVIHTYKETDRNRRKIFTNIASQQDNISVISICLNKKKVHTNWHDQKHALYNTLTNILLDRIYNDHISPNECVDIIASRRETKAVLNKEFKNYLEEQIRRQHKIKVDVKIATPMKEKCLQIADCASWAIFRDREHKDDTYKQIIKGVIVEEISLL